MATLAAARLAILTSLVSSAPVESLTPEVVRGLLLDFLDATAARNDGDISNARLTGALVKSLASGATGEEAVNASWVLSKIAALSGIDELAKLQPVYNAERILGGDEGIAINFRAREALIKDYSNVLSASGRPENLITLARASDATYFDRDGVLKTAGSNVLRHTYDPATREPKGLLVEGGATNLFLQSRFAASWNTSRSTKTANDTLGKDGTMGAATLTIDNTAGNSHYIYQPVSFESGKKYCKSILAKAGTQVGDGGRCLRFGPDSSANFIETGAVCFDLVEGVVSAGTGTIYSGGQYGMIDLGEGWYLCWVWMTAQATSSVNQVFYMAKGDGNPSLDGNGQDSIHIDEAQFEEGTAPSSRIRTTTVTASRSADSVVIGPDTFPVLPSGDCTLYWRGRLNGLRSGGGTGQLLSAKVADFSESILLREGVDISGVDARVLDENSPVADTVSQPVTLGAEYAFAASVHTDDLKFYSNGSLVAADTDLTLPAIDRLAITPSTGSIYEIDQIAYIARALPAGELAALTAV